MTRRTMGKLLPQVVALTKRSKTVPPRKEVGHSALFPVTQVGQVSAQPAPQ